MRIAMLINRSAGGFRRWPLLPTVTEVIAVFNAAGHEVEPLICGHRDLPAVTSAAASRDDIDAVIIGGGDGSVLTAILAGIGITRPLGILPLGTMNLLARDLGLSLDPVEAARSLATAPTAEIDLAEVNGLPFAIWASLGMHPWIVRRRDHLQRDGLGKWRALALAAFLALRRNPMVRATITVKNDSITVTSPLIIITNNAWREGRPPLVRRALDAGHLEVHVLRRASRMALIWLALNAMFGRWRSLLVTYSADTVRVTGRRRRTMVSLDGEVTVLRSPLIFRERPGALTVLMPPRQEE